MKGEVKKLLVGRKKLLQGANKDWLNLEDNLKIILQGATGIYRGEFHTNILTAENFKSNNISTKEKSPQTVLVKTQLKECHRWLKMVENYLGLIFSKGLFRKQKSPHAEGFHDFQEVNNLVAKFTQKGLGGTDE
ncbi:MAG: hypothetical protein M0P61_15025 [Ignavibacteriaceae bacterium]|nr:hypothetical protein [Ignavibacteriaceae bacterium]